MVFHRIENVRNRLTRLSSARGLRTQKCNTTTYGLSSLGYTGTKVFNTLKNDLLLNNVTNKNTVNAQFSTWPLTLIKQLGITK